MLIFSQESFSPASVYLCLPVYLYLPACLSVCLCVCLCVSLLPWVFCAEIKAMPSGTRLIALYDYAGKHDDELSFSANDIITLDSAQTEEGWLAGVHEASGKRGIFPANYVAVSNG